jgi:chemotaxis protein methyltransferase CheR
MTEPADVERFFVPAKGGGHVVRPEVRDLVELHRHNLVTEPPPFAPGEVDLVLCRNVTIYFGRDTTRALVERLHAVTAPGGYLFLGHAETLWQVSAEFQLVELGDAYVYRRDAEPRMLLPDRRIVEEGPPPLGMGPERRLRARRSPLPPVALARQVDRLLAVARLALREGDYAAAAEQAFAAARLEPMRAEAWYLRGVAFVNDRRDEEAVIDLRKACYADPDAGFTHFVLAGVLARLGQRGAAAHEYRAAAETLGRPGDETAAELGGRTLGELVTLCGRLATTMEREDRRERPA